ncbi:MAG: hypothetical protein JXA43_02160 [Candidatus Diapherotrites archaeon]|nr:hypothetical protein [Candidatus Diapherotrites archaeon]
MERGFFAFAVVLVVISGLVTINSSMLEKAKDWNEEIADEIIANHNYWLKVNVMQIYDEAIFWGVNNSESKIDPVIIEESISEIICSCIEDLEEKELLNFHITALTSGTEQIRNAKHKEITDCETQVQVLLDVESIPEPITKEQIVTVIVASPSSQYLYAKIGEEYAVLENKPRVYLCAKEGKCSLSMA